MASGAAVLAVLLGIAVFPSAGRRSSDPVAVQSVVGAPAATRQAMIGEEARDGQFTFVVEDLDCRTKDAASDLHAAPGAGKLCTLRFNVMNSGTSPAVLLGRFQYLVDGETKTYGADETLTRAVPENGKRGLSEISINPDVAVPLVFVFALPDSVVPTEAQFRGDGRSRFGVNVRLQRRT